MHKTAMTVTNMILATTALCNALMAGIFFAFSNPVMPGLKRLSDIEFLKSLQSITKVIQNPVFFIVFFGVLVLLPLCTFLNYEKPISTRFWLLLSATLIYLVGVFGVTIPGNIPMNEIPDKIDLMKIPAETISLQRVNFEAKWNNLNMIRTIAAAVSLLMVILSFVKPLKK